LTIDALLNQFKHFGVNLGLERIQRLLGALGNPHERVPIVHVTGSNGKGSVCAYLSAMLTEAGYRVGRYTSPHLVDWCERICLNEKAIAPTDLESLVQQVIAAIQPDAPSPTQFEVVTAAAWLYFAQQNVDIAVIEVGLGGRLDATNVCDRPLVTIITSLSLEHQQRLGPTLADIASEKAGILKPGCPAVIGQLPAEAASVVHRRLSALGCMAVYPQPALDRGNGWAEYRGMEEYPIDLDQSDLERLQAIGAEPDEIIASSEVQIIYRLPLQGAFQRQNSAMAIAAMLILRSQGWKISDEAITGGIAKTQWAGRLQWFTWHGQQILIDGAHNPASAVVLRQFVDELPPCPIHWVMGMLSTKDHADVFRAILRKGDRLYLVPVPDAHTADPQVLATLAQSICPDLATCQTYPDVFAALDASSSDAGCAEFAPLTILCGSLYLIGYFFKVAAQGSAVK